jgi:1,4-dihydroxy-2-naphthoyl-CoA synthase
MTDIYYKHAPHCQLQEMGDDVLIYNSSTEKTLHLNTTAASVWYLCESYSLQQMIEMLQEEYPTQSNQIESDVRDVVQNLCKQGILVLRKG